MVARSSARRIRAAEDILRAVEAGLPILVTKEDDERRSRPPVVGGDAASEDGEDPEHLEKVLRCGSDRHSFGRRRPGAGINPGINNDRR